MYRCICFVHAFDFGLHFIEIKVFVFVTNLHPLSNVVHLECRERIIEIHLEGNAVTCQEGQRRRVITGGTDIQAIVTPSSTGSQL